MYELQSDNARSPSSHRLKPMTRVLHREISQDDDGIHCYKGEPFTGVSYSADPAGRVTSECEFQGGLRSGVGRAWHRNGQLAEESHFYRDVIHGTSREWDDAGRLISELCCEYGITQSERRWDHNGVLTEDYRLQEGDDDYKLLQEYRRAYAPRDGESP